MGEAKRWMAVVTYLTARKCETVQFEELEELHDIIEAGPDWNEIDQIVVVLNRPCVDPDNMKQFENP